MSWTYASISLSSLPAKAGNPARRRLWARAPACLEGRAMTTSGRHYLIAQRDSGPVLSRADVAQEGIDVGPQPLGFAAQRCGSVEDLVGGGACLGGRVGDADD